MRLLILNWKDIRHPQVGGAEYVTHSVAKNLVRFGHQVTILSSGYTGLPEEETIDGIKIYRAGNIYTIYLIAVFLYLSKFKHITDIVIDQFHGIPFFLPLYVRKPIVGYMHEIAGEIWDYEFIFPFNFCGKLLEKLAFYMYKNTPLIVVSKSTRNEAVKAGLKAEKIHIITSTITKPRTIYIAKSKNPLLIYIGRLTPMKRIELLIEAAYLLKHKIPGLKIVIAGNGKPNYLSLLIDLISQWKLETVVEMKGWVSDIEKRRLFSQAWILVQPAVKEGLGLTILEAACYKTPAVCFDVAGLRDEVKHNYNGILVEQQSVKALTQVILDLLIDKKKIKVLGNNAFRYTQKLPSWQKQSQKFHHLLNRIYKEYYSHK